MRPVRVAEGSSPHYSRRSSRIRELLPENWKQELDVGDVPGIARRVADYIAGMTDRYAISEHRRLFDATPDLG